MRLPHCQSGCLVTPPLVSLGAVCPLPVPCDGRRAPHPTVDRTRGDIWIRYGFTDLWLSHAHACAHTHVMTCQNDKHRHVYPHYPPPLALPRPAYYSPYRGGTHTPDSIVRVGQPQASSNQVTCNPPATADGSKVQARCCLKVPCLLRRARRARRVRRARRARWL